MATAAAMPTLSIHRYDPPDSPASSPSYEITDFPALRRVKPLPNRRRIHSLSLTTRVSSNAIPSATSRPSNAELVKRLNSAGGAEGVMSSVIATLDSLQLPLSLSTPMLGPNVTPEDLLAHADRLTSQMAMHGYYLPILGEIQELFKGVATTGVGAGAGTNGVVSDLENMPASVSSVLGGNGSSSGGILGEEEFERGDRDRDEHLQQPGSAKKRKVPINTANGAAAGTGEGQGAEAGSQASAASSGDQSVGGGNGSRKVTVSLMPKRRGWVSAVTRAGLKHKETVKARKRQLATVLGAMSHGDTLAMDQALSASYPFAAAAGRMSAPGPDGITKGPASLKFRLSKRVGPRLARLTKASLKLRHPDKIGLAVSAFTFSCPSATAGRLVATTEEVAKLRARFEAELSRQATRATKLANAGKALTSPPVKQSPGKKRGSITHRAPFAGSALEADISSPDTLADATGSTTKPRGKKKKRSALANASNPHHLRNYVPSRLPHSGGQNGIHGQSQPQGQNDGLGPLPLRFLSTDISPRRGSRQRRGQPQPMTQLTNPGEEWICAYCEYELFFGDEQEYRRAIRNRRKVLRRRRRASERAAAAASGSSIAKGPEKVQEEDEEDYDDDDSESGDGAGREGSWKAEHHKDRERYG